MELEAIEVSDDYVVQLKEGYELAKERLQDCTNQSGRYDSKIMILLTINGILGGLLSAFLAWLYEHSGQGPYYRYVIIITIISIVILFCAVFRSVLVISFKSFQQFDIDKQFEAVVTFYRPDKGVADFYLSWIQTFSEYYDHNKKQVELKSSQVESIFKLLFASLFCLGVLGIISFINFFAP